MNTTTPLATLIENVQLSRIELANANHRIDRSIERRQPERCKAAWEGMLKCQAELNTWTFLAMNHPEMSDPLFTEWFGVDRAIPYPVSC